MTFRKSIAFRALLITFILLPLPLLVDSFVYLHARYQEKVSDAKEFIINEGNSKVYLLSRILQLKRGVFAIVEYYLNLKDDFPIAPSSELNAKLKKIVDNGGFVEMLLLEAKGKGNYKVLATSFENNLNNPLQSPSFYENFVKNEGQEEEFGMIYHHSSKKYYFILGRKIFSKKGELLGVMLFVDDISLPLKNIIGDPHPLENDTLNYAILGSKLEVVATNDKELLDQYFFPLPHGKTRTFTKTKPEVLQTLTTQPITVSFDSGYPFVTFTWKNEKQFGVIDPIPKTSFFLLAYAPRRSIFLAPLLHIVGVYTIYALILILGGLFAYLATYFFAKPLHSLTQTMVGIQQGNLKLRYKPEKLGFEINFLGLTFNKMIDDLLEKRRLEEEERIKTETYNEELRIGWEVQRSLLPEQMPNYSGVEIAARYLPAKEVGGDFYDVFIKKNEGREELILMVADGSGKGVGACFYSFCVRSYLRTFAKKYAHVSKIIADTNRLFTLDSQDSGMFVTAAFAIFDGQSKKLHWTSCGHNSFFILRANQQFEAMDERVMALGIDPTLRTFERVLDLHSGDLVFFYTDGVVDAQNEKGEFFSEEQLIKFLKDNREKNVQEIAETLLHTLKEFQGSAPQYDDITLLLMRVQ